MAYLNPTEFPLKFASAKRAPAAGRAVALVCCTALWGMAQAATFEMDEEQFVVGHVQTITAKYQDTLLAIAEEFELGYEELVAANPKLDSWIPGEGNRVLLPSKFIVPKKISGGIYINLAEYRLYYFPENKNDTVITFPISIGRGDWDTPVGQTHVISKLVKPAWYPPESIRKEHAEEGDPLPKVVPPGPDNPLGDYALQLNLPGYLIHGTNRPYGIGMRATHGCIRLRPEGIKTLFEQVKIETPVQISWEPFKTGVKDNVIYFEAHPARSEVEEILEGKSNVDMKQRKAALTHAIRQVLELADATEVEVDWLRLAEIVKESQGVPLPVSPSDRDMEITQLERRSTQSASQHKEYLF